MEMWGGKMYQAMVSGVSQRSINRPENGCNATSSHAKPITVAASLLPRPAEIMWCTSSLLLSSPASEILYHESALCAAHRNGNEISPKVPTLHFPIKNYSALSRQAREVGLEYDDHLCDPILNFSFKFTARVK